MIFLPAGRRFARRVAATAFGVTTATTLGLVTALAPASPANAHRPVVLTSGHHAGALADTPLVEDGSQSIAFFGQLTRPGDTRAVRLRFTAGQRFQAILLIPDRAPERALRSGQRPQLTVIGPTGTVEVLGSGASRPFHEPYTNTDYLIVSQLSRPAEAGTSVLIVSGCAAARFALGTGTIEGAATTIHNARAGRIADVRRWYQGS